MFELSGKGLSYSKQSILTRFDINKSFYKFHIFVEDKNKEYMYETIIKQLLKNDCTDEEFEQIAYYGLGGKQAVIKAYQANKQITIENSDIQSIYIVDGDFDRYIDNIKMIDSPNFIYLEAYNIENYLVDYLVDNEKVCCSTVKGKLHLMDKEVKQIINFNNWKKSIVNQAVKLYFLYCAIRKAAIACNYVSDAKCNFLDDSTGFERDNAYDDYYNEVKRDYFDIDLDKEISIIQEKYEKINGVNYYNLICGKFLFRSLCSYISAILRSRGINKNMLHDTLMWDMTKDININNFDSLKKRLLQLIKQ